MFIPKDFKLDHSSHHTLVPGPELIDLYKNKIYNYYQNKKIDYN